MNKIERLAAYVLFLVPVLSAPASSFAQSPFDGTWLTNMDQAKLPRKPYVFSLNQGMYDCFSCSPKTHVKADGTDQSVTGQPYDTISVRAVDPNSIAITLVRLLNRAVINALQRDRVVFILSLYRVVFAVQLCRVALACRIGITQFIATALVSRREGIFIRFNLVDSPRARSPVGSSRYLSYPRVRNFRAHRLTAVLRMVGILMG